MSHFSCFLTAKKKLIINPNKTKMKNYKKFQQELAKVEYQSSPVN